MLLAWLSASFQSVPPLPTSKSGPSCADSRVFVCVRVYILGLCRSLQWTLLWGWEFLPPPQHQQVFSVRDFEALFPHTGTLGCVVWLTPVLFFPVYLHANVGPVGCQPPPCRVSSPHRLPIFAPPTSLGECFFFNSLVGLWYSSIFWLFWLFFVFKFVVVLLWVVRGGKVYLPTPSSWLEVEC